MADLNALFQEVSSLSKGDAKQLKEMLEARMPKSELKKDKKGSDEAASKGGTDETTAE